jgi:hypothetical protein
MTSMRAAQRATEVHRAPTFWAAIRRRVDVAWRAKDCSFGERPLVKSRTSPSMRPVPCERKM